MLLDEFAEWNGPRFRVRANDMRMRAGQQGEVSRSQRERARLALDLQEAAPAGHDVERCTALGPRAHSPGRAELGAEVERPRQPDLFQDIREYVKHLRSERMDMKTGRSGIESAACR